MQEALLLFSSRSFKSFAIKKEFCIQIKQHISGAEKEEREGESDVCCIWRKEREKRGEAKRKGKWNEWWEWMRRRRESDKLGAKILAKHFLAAWDNKNSSYLPDRLIHVNHVDGLDLTGLDLSACWVSAIAAFDPARLVLLKALYLSRQDIYLCDATFDSSVHFGAAQRSELRPSSWSLEACNNE